MTLSTTFGKAGFLASLGMAALFAACSSDSGTTADAPPTTADAPPATVFNVTLEKSQEQPPCANAGANATGTATVTVAGDGSSIRVQMSYSGLSGTATAAHLHFGSSSVASGPVVLPFTNPASPIDQTFTSSDYISASGAPATFAAFVTMVKAGNASYLNVHVGPTLCPNGEIRGEIQ